MPNETHPADLLMRRCSAAALGVNHMTTTLDSRSRRLMLAVWLQTLRSTRIVVYLLITSRWSLNTRDDS